MIFIKDDIQLGEHEIELSALKTKHYAEKLNRCVAECCSNRPVTT